VSRGHYLTPRQSGAVACLLDGLNGRQGAAAMGMTPRSFYNLCRRVRNVTGDMKLTPLRMRRRSST